MEAVGEPLSKKQRMQAVAQWNADPKGKQEREVVVQKFTRVVTVKEPEHLKTKDGHDSSVADGATDEDDSSSFKSEATSKRLRDAHRGDDADGDESSNNASFSDFDE